MPDRYHIHISALAGRFHRVGKYGSIDWREDCSRCANCVKHRCEYEAYKKEGVHNRDPLAPVEPLNECKACLSCVQGCTKGLLSISINPEFLAMGDEYWTPDLIASTWNQAETGKIPVSGAGYRGRFHGPGFDSIWTDMSEIVRPTRDGIHGREYISTSVDIGPKPLRMTFLPDGSTSTPPANLIEIQFPAILDVPPWAMTDRSLSSARATAAVALKTLAVLRASEATAAPAETLANVVLLLESADEIASSAAILKKVRMVELANDAQVLASAKRLSESHPNLIVAVRLEIAAGAAETVSQLAAAGIKVFHLAADLHGRERGVAQPRHLKDTLREIHGRLVSDGLRDEITLIAGGGIGAPEHMAKAIICGADLVAVDTPLLVALGCRVCRGAHTDSKSGRPDAACPADVAESEVGYAAHRMVNLMGAWHSQLIEVLGAMGIREVRRLRGEVGRAVFVEDIEREAFGDLVRK